MPLTHLGSQEMLQVIMTNTLKSFSTTVELALFTQAAGGPGAAPDDNPASGAAGTDVLEIDTGTGYAREPTTFGTATAASPSVISNTNLLAYTQATAQWGSTTHPTGFVGGWVVYDTSATEIPVWVGAFNTAKQVLNLDTVSIAMGDLTLQLD